MEVRKVALAAGVPVRIDTPGRFFMLTDTSAPLDVEFIKSQSLTREKASEVEEGYQSKPDPTLGPEVDQSFDGIRLTSPTAQTVQYAISARSGDYTKIGINVEIEQPNTIRTVADITVSTTAVVVLAADSNRKHGTIRNTSANNIRLGDQANVAAGRGYQLRGGEFYTHDGTDALYAVREGASDGTVCVIEHRRV